MKKILIALVLVFPFSVALAFGGGDKVVSKKELPAQAQSLINEYFASAKISYAKLETDFLERSYEVMLADGVKLEFTKKGSWKEVDCRYGEVPAGIVPAAIKNYVAENYPEAKIIKIERDGREYDVKLSNKLELTFNKDFKIIDIDN